MRTERILYLTVDGLLSPLGYSQVVRPLVALAATGRKFVVVSLEPECGLRDWERVSRLSSLLADADIEWRYDGYATSPSTLSPATNVARLLALASKALRDHRVRLAHARSYVAGLAALALKAAAKVPYLFDIRGYWIDEKLDENRWFTSSARLGVARAVERQLFAHASGLVTLTETAAADIRGHLFTRWREDVPVCCIPTLVDYEQFTPPGARFARPKPLRDRLVIGHVGALNRAYRIEEGFQLARRVLEIRDDAVFAVVTQQREQAEALLECTGIAPDRALVASSHPEDVVQWLRALDWGLLFRSSSFASRAAMPTKLGEFLAVGVRPVHWGGNEDIRDWVRRTGSGLTLDDLASESLGHAARTIAESTPVHGATTQARRIAEPHFALHRGVNRYGELYDQLIASRPRRE